MKKNVCFAEVTCFKAVLLSTISEMHWRTATLLVSHLDLLPEVALIPLRHLPDAFHCSTSVCHSCTRMDSRAPYRWVRRTQSIRGSNHHREWWVRRLRVPHRHSGATREHCQPDTRRVPLPSPSCLNSNCHRIDVINSAVYSTFATGPIMIDHDNTVKSYSVSPSVLGRGHILMEPDGPVWVSSVLAPHIVLPDHSSERERVGISSSNRCRIGRRIVYDHQHPQIHT